MLFCETLKPFLSEPTFHWLWHFFFKLWLSVCILLNMFPLGFNTSAASRVFILRAKLWKIVMKCQIAISLTFVIFFKKLTFLRLWHFISPYSDPMNSIFAVVDRISKIQFLKKFFSHVATVATITEKLTFFCLHGNHC